MAKKVPYATAKKILTTIYKTGGTPDSSPAGPTPTGPGVVAPASLLQISSAENNLRVTRQQRRNTIVVSPFMPEDPSLKEKMKRYANRATRDSLNKGEAPMPVHLFYTALNDKDPIERDIGLQAQLSWMKAADLIAVYTDFGITPAMKVVLNNAKLMQKKIELRVIGSVA